MKTLENISTNNLFIILRNMGIQYDAIVTDSKNLGAMTAAMLYGANCGSRVYSIMITDIDTKTCEELEFPTSGTSYNHRFSFNAKAEKYQDLLNHAANTDNQYNPVECIRSYKFKPFYLFVCVRDGAEKLIIKATKKDKAQSFIDANGWETKMMEHVTELHKMSYLSIYERFTGKEEPGLGYHHISGSAYKFLLNWNKTEE